MSGSIQFESVTAWVISFKNYNNSIRITIAIFMLLTKKVRFGDDPFAPDPANQKGVKPGFKL